MTRPRKPLLAIDWDGVLTSDRKQTWPLEDLDLTLVREALDRGWAVQIFTANGKLDRIARELRQRGISVFVDRHLRYRDWQGGKSGRTVIISTRKMWVRAILDDRAHNFQYGDDPYAALDALESVREWSAA